MPSHPDVRKARLFKNAGNLAVRIPVDWHIDADEAELAFDGQVITVTPIRRKESLAGLLKEFADRPIDDDWEDPVDLSPAKNIAL